MSHFGTVLLVILFGHTKQTNTYKLMDVLSQEAMRQKRPRTKYGMASVHTVFAVLSTNKQVIALSLGKVNDNQGLK